MREEDSADHGLKVALDATPLLGRPTGVGVFCRGAIAALARRPELEVSAFAVSWRRRRELVPLLPSGVGHRQRSMPARPLHMAWKHASVPAVELFVGEVDVVHGTNYVVPPTRRAARVVTVHDLTSVRYPEMCDRPSLEFPRMVRRAVASGSWVHTPSKFVADEVVAELGVDESRVRAVYHGVPDLAPDSAAVDEAPPAALPGGCRRYVLAVGTVEPRKDYPTLVRSFDSLPPSLSDVSLVIVGADGWGAEALETALDTSRSRDRIVRLGYVAESQLSALLRGASVVAYPSLYEGFGLVPLEAMAAGVPVVATSAGAIPEVVGDGALLVPPRDAEALAAGLATALSDDEERKRLVGSGRARAAYFTWEECAAGLSSLYAAANAP